MSKVLTFWQRRGTFGKIVLVFAALCVANWTRLALVRAGLVVKTPIEQPNLVATPSTEPSESPNSGSWTEDPPSVNLGHYQALKSGMSYSEVCRLLGDAGVEVSSSDIAGTHTAMYQWKAGRFGANMNAMFQNDRLVSKAQMGLR